MHARKGMFGKPQLYSESNIYIIMRTVLSTYPQSLDCRELCVRGTGCDSVSGNHALKTGQSVQKSFRGLIAINPRRRHAQGMFPNSPAAVKPLTRAWASWPAPMKPTLILPVYVYTEESISFQHRSIIQPNIVCYNPGHTMLCYIVAGNLFTLPHQTTFLHTQ